MQTTDPSEAIAQLHAAFARQRELEAEDVPLKAALRAIADASSGPAAPAVDEAAVLALEKELRGLAARSWLGLTPRAELDAKRAQHAKMKAEIAKDRSAAIAAAEHAQLGREGIEELRAPLEAEHNRLAARIDRLVREFTAAQMHQAAEELAQLERQVGEGVARVAAYSAVLNELERIGTAAATPAAERLSVGTFTGAQLEVPALLRMRGFEGCDRPVRRVILNRRLVQPFGGDIVIDGPGIEAEVRASIAAATARS